MINIAIITICDNNNYGNRLQNYAFHKLLTNYRISNVTLWDENENTIKEQFKFMIKKTENIKNAF